LAEDLPGYVGDLAGDMIEDCYAALNRLNGFGYCSQATPSPSLSSFERYPGSPAYIGAAPAATAASQLA
jgi:hypothetical protein